MAKGAGLGIGPLDAVQIAYNGTPIFYGEVRVGGNPQDVDGHQFTLRSLALRLKEVVIPSARAFAATEPSTSGLVSPLFACPSLTSTSVAPVADAARRKGPTPPGARAGRRREVVGCLSPSSVRSERRSGPR